MGSFSMRSPVATGTSSAARTAASTAGMGCGAVGDVHGGGYWPAPF